MRGLALGLFESRYLEVYQSRQFQLRLSITLSRRKGRCLEKVLGLGSGRGGSGLGIRCLCRLELGPLPLAQLEVFLCLFRDQLKFSYRCDK